MGNAFVMSNTLANAKSKWKWKHQKKTLKVQVLYLEIIDVRVKTLCCENDVNGNSLLIDVMGKALTNANSKPKWKHQITTLNIQVLYLEILLQSIFWEKRWISSVQRTLAVYNMMQNSRYMRQWFVCSSAKSKSDVLPSILWVVCFWSPNYDARQDSIQSGPLKINLL